MTDYNGVIMFKSKTTKNNGKVTVNAFVYLNILCGRNNFTFRILINPVVKDISIFLGL